jgi:hypothetical protein
MASATSCVYHGGGCHVEWIIGFPPEQANEAALCKLLLT